MKNNNLDDIVTKLKMQFQKEYERGGDDALKRVVGAMKVPTRPNAPKRTQRSGKARAPRGTARALIQRVLKEQESGVAVPVIMAAAKSPAEKAISVAAIRFELYRGKKVRQYRNHDGKWSLPARRSSAA